MNQGPLPQRLRLGPVALDRYLAGQLSGLAYMRRLRAIEARVPMNPRTGTYSRNWRRSEYGPEWILERFPAVRDLVPRGSGERPPET